MQFSRQWLLAAVGAGLLAGCATQSPPMPAEIHRQSGTLNNLVLTSAWKAAPVSTNAIQDNWLATFQDDQLNALVAEAMTNNPDLRVASSRVEQAWHYVRLAKAALRPTVNLFGTGGLNMGGGDISSALQGISLGASWEPDLWGRMRYGRNAAQATHASARADYEFSRQSLAATIAKSWFTATETWLQLQIAEDMVQAARQLLTLAETRRRVGAGSEEEIALARADLATYQDTARQVRFAHEQTLRALELLLGRYPAAELQARRDMVALPSAIPAGLPLEMLERRPDVIAAERRVAAAFHRVGEAKAARLPRLILNANAAAIDSDILQLKEDFENPTGGAGAKLLAPIYQGGALKTQVEIRSLEQKQAVAEYARISLRALSDVENSLSSARALRDRQSFLEQAVAENQRALDLAQTNYRIGRGDLRNVQHQQLTVCAARLALLRVRSEQLGERVNLHLSLGGSFEPSMMAEVNLTMK
ncbi:MAG TPA: efflux transporter outer membrane subunit [Candidatus Paceibacterota bacterium]|nr:efflux transporter outer membrane subunit [Verrucomicrobiota bacterium]HRZ47257.1 efflux transporter outer membrane subunit [Candidatus Paceibacterota bacterium]HRZ56967.1 efflux transporter outer membrane subunit [Candidatus Paceibacterota bacterium]